MLYVRILVTSLYFKVKGQIMKNYKIKWEKQYLIFIFSFIVADMIIVIEIHELYNLEEFRNMHF
jgi:hypothetical protein